MASCSEAAAYWDLYRSSIFLGANFDSQGFCVPLAPTNQNTFDSRIVAQIGENNRLEESAVIVR